MHVPSNVHVHCTVPKFFRTMNIMVLMYISLPVYRATMTHASIPKEEREKIGIADTLVRLCKSYLLLDYAISHHRL